MSIREGYYSEQAIEHLASAEKADSTTSALTFISLAQVYATLEVANATYVAAETAGA